MSVMWLAMKIPKQKISGILPDWHLRYEKIGNGSFVLGLPLECFEIWGYLAYTSKISKQICDFLSDQKRISEN